MGLPISLLFALCIYPNPLWGEATYSSNSGSSSESSQYISFAHFLLGYLLPSYCWMGTMYILKITALLAYNAQSHNILHFTVYSTVVFSLCTELGNHHHYLVSEHFHHLQKKSCTPRASPHFPASPPSRPRQLPVSFLTLQICLLWIFHINGII